MGFMDENAGGGGPPLLKWNGNEGKYLSTTAMSTSTTKPSSSIRRAPSPVI